MKNVFGNLFGDQIQNRSSLVDTSKITSLMELRSFIQAYDHEVCEKLRSTAKNFVFSSGPENSPLMLIGEAPGKTEDELGLPFVGDAGTILTKMLEFVQISRNKTYITNVVNWRPENNATPTLRQIEFFRPFLLKHIELQKPKVILVLGAVAMKAIGIMHATITQARSRNSNPYILCGAVVFFTYHPAYVLRNSKSETVKAHIRQDLFYLNEHLKKIEVKHLLSETV